MTSVSDPLTDLSAGKRALLALKKLQAKYSALESAQKEPIAIVGAGCRFPGGVDDLDSYWRLLRSGVDAISDVPPDRFDIDAHYDPDPDAPGKTYARRGGFLPRADRFDARFFGLSPREAEHMDPQHRLLLEVCWEALEHAGEAVDRLSGSRTGVYVGIGINDYSDLLEGDGYLEKIDAYAGTGNGFCFAAGRISYLLSLNGPTLSLDTACSSSLVAIHLACQALRARECNLALAGGVNALLSPATYVFLSRARALSPDGRCKTFDAAANGYVRGEGCGVVVLKRLSDALAEGSDILAVIRGSAVNHDGASSGFTVPNGLAQRALLRQALDYAGLEPAAIGYVEAHGTGTRLGDPIEMEALGAVLGEGRAKERPLVVGGVKTNIGHLEAAAGVAGLLKTVLTLRHGEIPPHLNFKEPNPLISWDELQVKVATERLPFPGPGPRLAGVSSFGLSGTNAHVILEEAPTPKASAPAPERPAELVVLSAKSSAALGEAAGRLSAHLSGHPELGLGEVAWTAATARSLMDHRLAVVARSREALATALRAASEGQTPPGAVQRAVATPRGKLAFLFTGQGAQVPGMGRALWGAWPVFREAFDRCVSLFERELEQPLRQVMWAERGRAEAATLDQTAYTQAALFTLEYALAALWGSWGVKPELVLGHSLGEIVAACVAGVLSLEDTVRLVGARGRLMQALPAGGAVVAIGAPEAEVAAAVAPHGAEVSIAAINGPAQVVISGAAGPVEAIAASFAARGVRTKSLPVSHAFHSPLIEPMLEAFGRVAASLTYQRPSLGLVSNLYGKLVTDEVTSPAYWVRHVREAVRFSDGVRALYQAGASTLIEVGPRPSLSSLVLDCQPEAEVVLLASLRASLEEPVSVLEALGGLWAAGGAVDWTGVFAAGMRRVPLPTYPWQRERYWVEAPAEGPSARRTYGAHPLLDASFEAAPLPGVRLWSSTLSTTAHPWLSDHRVHDAVVLPGAAYIEMALAAGAVSFGGAPFEIRNMELERMLVLPPEGQASVQLALTPEGEGGAVQISSQEQGAWHRHARATLRRVTGPGPDAPHADDIAAIQARCPATLRAPELYRRFSDLGMGYGPHFQGVEQMWLGEDEVLGRVCLPQVPRPNAWHMHPALLDACLQMSAGLLETIAGSQGSNGVSVPVSVERVFLHARPPAHLWVHGRRRHGEGADTSSVAADLRMVDDEGRLVAEVEGLRLQRIAPTAIPGRDAVAEWLFAPVWRRLHAPAESIREPTTRGVGAWLLLTDRAGVGAALQAQLSARGEQCVVVEHGPGFAQLGAAHFRVDPADAEAMDRVLRSAFPDDAPCRGAVHLWSLDSTPLEATTPESLDADLTRGSLSALHLVQALTRQTWRDVPRLWLVTRGAQAVGKDGGLALSQAPLWGLGRVVAIEHPELECVRVDLPLHAAPDDAQALLGELGAAGKEDQVALRPEGRFGLRLTRLDAPPTGDLVRFGEDGSYLLTGGLGGLGLSIAAWLVARGARHLVLVGRSGASEEAQAAIAALEAQGARVEVLRADVSRQDEVARVLAEIDERLPPLRGVVHAAGVVDDATLLTQDAARFRAVMAPKVHGGWNLHALTAGRPLDFFVLYASAAGMLGSPGQGNYAAANTFLDALSYHRRAQGLPALSIDWGVFAEIGLAAAQENRGTRLAYRGMAGLTPGEGQLALERIWSGGGAQVGVLKLDLRRWMEFYPAAASSPMWEDLRQEAERQRFAVAAPGKLRVELEQAEPGVRALRLERHLAAVLGQVLRIAPDQIDRRATFSSFGIDSLMGIEVRNRLEVDLSERFSAALLFTYPTLTALTEHLCERLSPVATRAPKPAASEPSSLAGQVTIATQAATEVTEPPSSAAIAIIGLGCRFPGGGDDPEAFWRALEAGVDAVVQVPPDRWPLRDEPGAGPAQRASRWGAFLEDVRGFDASFFGISPREAQKLDPQQRLLLEVTWEALEDAGIVPERLSGTRTGVFLGISTNDYGELCAALSPELQDVYVTTGNGHCFPPGRIAYTLGLEGPALAVDTACSSSLVALHLGCQALREGDCGVALIGGVNLMLSPSSTTAIAQAQALSPDGRCRTFDASANGFVRGEGCGVVVLKRLQDAQRDGDSILAVIRGSTVNQDGRSTGLTAPNVLAQQAMLREALQRAGASPGDIDYIECHGTGTSLGDPIEVEALAEVLGKGRAPHAPCVLGAVKTNIGHLEAAAGVAGLIKAVLAMRHEAIPRNLHFKTLNPRIDLVGAPLVIPTQAVRWPRKETRRLAGVSSFGLSGTNAHVVLEEGPATRRQGGSTAARSAELMIVSAKSEAALAAAARRLAEHVEGEPSLGLCELSHGLATTRSAFEFRLAAVASSREGLRQALKAAAEGQAAPGVVRARARRRGETKVVFVFPGQGSQWRGMGRQLLGEEAVFRDQLVACDRAIRAEAGWSLLEELEASEDASRLDRIDVVQPALFAMGVALAALWRSWGVEPDAVVGHSMGEVAAAHVAGALSLEDAVAIICRRSRLLRRLSGRGEMAVVELSIAEAEQALAGYEDRLSVAVSNSPRSTVLSGEPGALTEVLAKLETRGVFCRRVKVDVASHSPQVEPLREELLSALQAIAPRATSVRMLSTVLDRDVEGRELGAPYWVDNLRQPVRFAQAVTALTQAGHGLFVEMSAHPLLVPAVEEILRAGERPGVAVGSLRRGHPERPSLLEGLGALWVQGYEVAWEKLFPAGVPRAPLPTYPWQRERYWIDAPARGPSARRPHAGGHPLLGEGLRVSTQGGTRLWETVVDGARMPWIKDHKVQGAVVLPGAAYLEMALAVGAEVFGGEAFEVVDVVLPRALIFAGEPEARMQLVTTEEQPERLQFQIASLGPTAVRDAWSVHARGALRRVASPGAAPNLELGALRARLGASLSSARTYEVLEEMGLAYGPSFAGVTELWKGEGEALGHVKRPEILGDASAYQMHPALLDACLQVMAGTITRDGDATPWVPVEVGSLRLVQRPPAELWCHAQARPRDGASDRQSVDVRIVDGQGALVAEITGLVVQRLATNARRPAEDGDLEVVWEPVPVPAAQLTACRWLLLGGGALGQSLRAGLEASGHTVVWAAAEVTSAAEMRALLSEAMGGQPPTVLVHLRSLEVGGGLDAETVEAAVSRGVESVLWTVQALAGMGYRDAPRLWIVTRGAQAVGTNEVNVAQALLIGLGRTVALEHVDLRCSQLDLDPAAPADEVEALQAELVADDAEEEVALRPEGRRVARLIRRPSDDEPRRERSEPAGRRPHRLEIEKPGVLDRLVLRSFELRAPGPGEVQIAVEATGLNFIDVMKAMGIYPGLGQGPASLGGECAGRIVAVGAGVEGLRVGEDVVAIALFSCGTHVLADARMVAPRPAGLTAVQAAALPTVFMTSWYGLVHMARLQAGERVLIHSAAGGTGLAAVQIARHLGAEVIATAGSPEKRAWLHEQGITHVMDSRSLAFAEQVLAVTGGEGVDVVLNSLSGDAIEASMKALAPDGRFVEIGKTDIYADRALGLAPFKKGLSYSAVDLAGLAMRRPARFAALLREVMALFTDGVLSPLPVETFPLSRAPEAFRKMAQAQHVGKLVLTRDDDDVSILVAAEARPRVRAEGSYMVTGGLGGLGLSVAGWLAEQGAGHLVLLGRSGATRPEQQAAVAQMRARGTRVTVVQADVASRSDLERALGAVAASGMPLRGVIHAAAVLDDGLLLQQDAARVRAVLAPKVRGALHLHELTRDDGLDFFVMYASVAGLLGSPGQGSYASANTFLDALAHRRRAEGQPGLSIDWGAFAEVGLAAAQANRGARLATRGMRSLTPEEGLEILSRLLESDRAQVGVAPIDMRQWVEFYPAAVSSRRLARLVSEARASAARRTGDRELLERLRLADPELRARLLQDVLRAQVAQVLRMPEASIEADAPLTSLGMDSLMGLELRNRIEAALGITVPATLLWTYPTVAALSAHLARGEASAEPLPQAVPPPADDEIEDMSLDELERMIDTKFEVLT